MKERGIIFNAEMVRAILDGRKTQTRRVIKNQRVGENWNVQSAQNPRVVGHTHDWWLPTGTQPYSALPACPFGTVGDRLWLRETFSCICNEDGHPVDSKGKLCSREDAQRIYKARSVQKPNNYGLWTSPDGFDFEGTWTPSIHMPRWASRITLEITGVRVERLQAISQGDAIAEGAPPSHPSIDAVSRDYGFPDFSRSWFGQTWWSIYGEESWQANPWVWCISFKRVEVTND